MIALAIFAYQMHAAVVKYFKFSTVPTEETKDLAEVKLPIILFCLGDDDQYRNRYGYHGLSEFLLGSIEKNTEFVTWNGNGNLSYAEVVDGVFTYIEDLKFHGYSDEWKINGNPVELKKQTTVFDGKCNIVDMSDLKYFNMEIMRLETEIGDNDFKVFITDPDMSLYHAINSDSMETKRDCSSYFAIELEEIHRSKEREECAEYGNEQTFQTFADCVENEYRKVFQPILGCKVPWLSGPDHPAVCNGRIPLTDDAKQNFTDIVKDLEFKFERRIWDYSLACPPPCTEIVAHKTMKKEVLVPGKIEIVLNLRRRVKVSGHMLAYGIFDLVVEVGSSLGLWIGLSALGIFDLFVDAKPIVKNIFKKKTTP